MNDYILIGSGELGDMIYFNNEAGSVDTVRSLLMDLENVESNKVDLETLLKPFTYFHQLLNVTFPPLYSVRDFLELDGFDIIEEMPVDDMPGMSFIQVEIYIDRELKTMVLEQFDLLSERLNNFYENLLKE